jgi:LysR family transcriptional activator of mexEF-oprN operon
MVGWLLPALLDDLRGSAPNMRIVAVPVQFRTVAERLHAQSLDLAISVADELPPSIERVTLMRSSFVCLFDPRHVKLRGRISEREYFAHEHVIVSYNADLRGIVEDMFHKQRRVRCSIGSFSLIGALVEGGALIATVPDVVAAYTQRLFPKLVAAEPPFELQGGGVELLFPSSTAEDAACKFVRERVSAVATALARESRLQMHGKKRRQKP